MNEAQIIQHQLAIERRHFSQVGEIFGAALQSPPAPDDALMRACIDYFVFALTRLPPDQSREAETRLRAARQTQGAASLRCWQDFMQAFANACREHSSAIEALQARQESIVHWRALARLDADAIIVERERFSRVQACMGVPS